MKQFELYSILICPECGGELSHLMEENQNDLNSFFICSKCKIKFPIEKNIPELLKKNIENSEMDYVVHYTKDAELFDYFEQRECKATEHEERRVREFIISNVPANAELILDVGSGGSWLSKNLDFDNHILITFDLSKKNVHRSIIENSNKNHYGLVADALNPPIKENSLECIIASEIIEHLVEPKDFICKMIKILKPGGSLILSTPYKEVIPYYLCIHCNQMTPKNAHLHSFDEHKLLEYFKNLDNEVNYNIKYFIFGNKALNILRTHIFMKYLPFSIWKLIDKVSNLIIKKPAHIIVVYKKTNTT